MFDISAYYEATSLDEVFAILAEQPHAKLIAGGTDVLVKLRDRNADLLGAPLVGITRIPALSGIELADNGTLSIGAASTFSTIEQHALIQKHAPLLAFAVSTVGGPQTRNAGTIGGNVCNGATSADSAPALFAYNATLEIHSPTGVKEVAIADFYKGAGIVDLKPGEVLAKIKISKENYHGFIGHYTKFAQRNALDIANLSCSTLFKEKDDRIDNLRICFGVAGPTPLRMPIAEAYGQGKEITDEALAEIGKKCLENVKTRDSWRATKEYRDHLVAILPGRNIRAALGGN